MKEVVDYYVVLGIDYAATVDQIRAAYRKKARELHPDAHSGEELTEDELEKMRREFTVVTEAYKTLKDEDSKQQYDIKLFEYLKEKQRREEQKKQDEQRRQEEQKRQEQERQRQAYEDAKRRKEESKKKSSKGKKKSFTESVKQAYKEVREDEKKYPFRKRHERLSDSFDNETEMSLPKTIVVNIGRGTLHVMLEAFYQLNKLTYVNKDTVTKYVIRNRRLAAGILAGTIIFSAGSKTNEAPKPVDTETVYETSDEYSTESNNDGYDIIFDGESSEELTGLDMDLNVDESIVRLTRNYKIKSGDTLSELAEAAHISVYELQEENDLESDMIYEGKLLTIPYMINNEDLSLYVARVNSKGKNIFDMAKEYSTTVDTIYNLNRERIVIKDGEYIILSDMLYVPNFITIQEYIDYKEIEKVKTR